MEPFDGALPEYVALLASLDGDVPGLSTAITDLKEVPAWMRQWARDNDIELRLPIVRRSRDLTYEVIILVYANALFEVTAHVGENRFEDQVTDVRLLVGNPPG